MLAHSVSVQILVSHPLYRMLVEPALARAGLTPTEQSSFGVAQIVLDYPLTWAFTQLSSMNSIERARTLIATQTDNPTYLDTLASFHPSGVVPTIDEASLLSAIYAAASAQKSYHRKSSLTYMELRVTRLLLTGLDTKSLAGELNISYKTVNAHVSNILCKLGYDSRAQYIATLIGGPFDREP